jgi:hypothetical protein
MALQVPQPILTLTALHGTAGAATDLNNQLQLSVRDSSNP